MATNITSTQLDFQTIKNKLKTYFAQQPEFADYDFEGAGLSNLLDVLAYNTHFNGLIANFALNETFLTTAQLRSSVVAHAETLGYNPQSKTAAVAYVTLQLVNTSVDRSSTVTLPAHTQFSGSVDGLAYNFQTLEPYTATDNGTGIYQFVTSQGSTSIPIYEGTITTKNFLVGDTSDRQVFVIPNANIDTSTLIVNVYQSSTSSTFATYTNIKNAITVNAESRVYDIHEAPNGFWEIHFSDGFTLGNAPTVGNKIVITYLSTNGELANGATAFQPATTVSMDGQQYALTALTVSPSAGGTDKENIESIRANAPITFASQQRLVTPLDYRGQILSKFSLVEDCIAWGGEDNIPAYYGKVLVSLKFQDNVDSDGIVNTKSNIVNNLTNHLAMMSIDTMFVDPQVLYVGCQTRFNYDTSLSNTPIGVVQSQVLNTITDYFNTTLGGFGSTFRRSNLLTSIDDISPAILNSRMDVVLQRRFTPILANTQSYSIVFPVPLSTANGIDYVVTSNSFTHGGQRVTIANELVVGSTKLQLIDPESNVIVDNIGSFSPETGVINLIGFTPTSISGATDIKINAVPANQSTVQLSQNFIFDLDLSTSFVIGTREI